MRHPEKSAPGSEMENPGGGHWGPGSSFLHLSPHLSARLIHLLWLFCRVLFPVHSNTPEATAVLPAGVPENTGAGGNQKPPAAQSGQWAAAGLCHCGQAHKGQWPVAWLPRARRSAPGSRASGPAPQQRQGGAVIPRYLPQAHSQPSFPTAPCSH